MCSRWQVEQVQTAFQAVMQCSLEVTAAESHLLRGDEQDDGIVRGAAPQSVVHSGLLLPLHAATEESAPNACLCQVEDLQYHMQPGRPSVRE